MEQQKTNSLKELINALKNSGTLPENKCCTLHSPRGCNIATIQRSNMNSLWQLYWLNENKPKYLH